MKDSHESSRKGKKRKINVEGKKFSAVRFIHSYPILMPRSSPGQKSSSCEKSGCAGKTKQDRKLEPNQGTPKQCHKGGRQSRGCCVIMKTEKLERNRGSEGNLSSLTGERKTCRRDAFNSSVTPPTPCDDRIEEAKVERRY